MGQREGGFALVEMIATLAVMAMISWMLIAGVATGRRVWQRLDEAATAADDVDGAQTALRRRIEDAYPATLYEDAGPSVDFAGSSHWIAFLAQPPDGGRPAPLRRYRLFLTARDELALSSVSDVAAGVAPEARVLLSGVQGLDIAYFGAAPPDGIRRWREDWKDAPSPPELVRVRIALRPGDRRRWPDLIIHPRATIDSECVLNPSTGLCRGRS
ncbi:MAG: hypothetical protein ACYC8V_05560 [Caulobacteraceae bacterium]